MPPQRLEDIQSRRKVHAPNTAQRKAGALLRFLFADPPTADILQQLMKKQQLSARNSRTQHTLCHPCLAAQQCARAHRRW